MDRRVVWTESAWRELESAASYIAQDSPRYAAALIAEAKDTARSLRRFAMRGRAVPEIRDDRVREVHVKSYRLIYEVSHDSVTILAVIHGARLISGDFLRLPE